VNTYSTLALAAGILASAVWGRTESETRCCTLAAFEKTESAIGGWQAQIAGQFLVCGAERPRTSSLADAAWEVVMSPGYFGKRA